MAGLLQARPAHLESVLCAISHPNAWENMTKDHFCPFQAPFQDSRGKKNCYFYGKIASKGRASSRVGQPTWKVSCAPYHTPMHGRAWLWTIFAHSRLLRVPKKTLLLDWNHAEMAWPLQVRPAHIGKCSRLYCLPHHLWILLIESHKEYSKYIIY